MRAWSKLAVFAVAVAAASPAGAAAPSCLQYSGSSISGTSSCVAFPAGSLIIPMDQCNQPSSAKAYNPSFDTKNCVTTPTTADDGLFKAYGLIYRLLQQGIPVSIAIDTSKTAIDASDF